MADYEMSKDLTSEYVQKNAELFTKLTDDIVKIINDSLYDTKEVNAFRKMNLSKEIEQDREHIDTTNKENVG